MIDFKNAAYFKLKQTDNEVFSKYIFPMLIPGESIVATYRGIRDGVVFTTHRIIAVNIQGMTGTKKDFTIMPYNKVQLFSVETAGVLDMESELTLWFSTLGTVKFEFVSSANVADICRMISARAL